MILIKVLTAKIDLKKLNPTFNINPVFSKQFFIDIFLFFSLMPYVSPVPLGSDIQIVTGFLGYIIIFVLLLKDRFLMDKREILIFFISLFFLLYINFDEPTYQFRKAIGPIYSFGIYFIAKYYNKYFKLRILDIVLIIYFVGALTQYLSPGLFNLTFEHFIRMSKYSAEVTYRGVASLTPEPSFLGIICVFILIIQDWYYKKNDLIRDKSYYIRVLVCIFLVIISKSGAGYILLFLFGASKSFSHVKKYWFPLTLVVVIGIFVIVNTDRISNNKGLSDLVMILKSSSPKDLLRVSSLSNRVNPIIVGITGAIEEPLGRGSGSFTTQAREVYLRNGLEEIYPPGAYLRGKLLQEISVDSVSTFGKYIFEYGIFFLLYLFLIFAGLNFRKAGAFSVFLIMTSLLFALPIVYPPLWLIFGLYDKKVKMS